MKAHGNVLTIPMEVNTCQMLLSIVRESKENVSKFHTLLTLGIAVCSRWLATESFKGEQQADPIFWHVGHRLQAGEREMRPIAEDDGS